MLWTALAIPALVWAQNTSEEDFLVGKARFTLENFLSDPDMQWFRDHMKDARGMLIVPQFIKGAFFIGGSGGSGLLVVRDEKTNEWNYPAFFTLGGASFGLQFGGQASEVVLLVLPMETQAPYWPQPWTVGWGGERWMAQWIHGMMFSRPSSTGQPGCPNGFVNGGQRISLLSVMWSEGAFDSFFFD